MHSSDIGPTITAIAVLVTAITTLISVVRNGRKIDVVATQTNGTLAGLHAKVDAALAQKATAAELDARPPMPPVGLPDRIHPKE